MVKICKREDIEKIKNSEAQNLLYKRFDSIYHSIGCGIYDSIAKFGEIFFIEEDSDWDNYKELHLSEPISEKRFESIIIHYRNRNNLCSNIHTYLEGTIVINNDYCISVIGTQKVYERILMGSDIE